MMNYFDTNEYKYTLRANRLFFNMDWKLFPKPGVTTVPSGFTMDVITDEQDNVTGYAFTTKIYGYDHSGNNGVTSYSDLEDFCYGDDSLITEDLKAAALEYLKQKDTDFYNLIKDMHHDCF
jgi:hypothetical protein